MIPYSETKYGFEFGAAKVERCFSDAAKGWVVLRLQTPKHQGHSEIQIYVTKTGKVRIFDSSGEWVMPMPRKFGAAQQIKTWSNTR